MIRILTAGRDHWAAEERRANELADGLTEIFAGRRPTPDFISALDTYRSWARDARVHKRRAVRKLREWRAKRI